MLLPLVGASGVHLDASDPAHPVMPGPLQRGEAAEYLFQLDEIHHAIVEYQAIGATVASDILKVSAVGGTGG